MQTRREPNVYSWSKLWRKIAKKLKRLYKSTRA